MIESYRNARGNALAEARRVPSALQVAANTISSLRAFNLCDALLDYVARLGPPERMPIPLLLVLARNLSALNLQSRALVLLDEAIRGDPDYPPALLARSQVLMYMGRNSDAKVDAMRCLARAPEMSQGWWILAHLERQTASSNHVGQIRAQCKRLGHKPVDAAFLNYALHKALDDLGDQVGAWSALETACKAKRSTLTYAPGDTRALVDALVSQPVLEPLESADQSGPTPIFIVGMHRSGTTLLEQLLDASPDVAGIGELYDFTSAMRHATDHHCRGVVDQTIVQRSNAVDFSAVGRSYLDSVAWRLGAAPFFTDKLPSNFLNIGFICRALPHARILHMVRDPMETCFSNLRELFSDANPYSYDQGELAGFFLQYQRLMEHWHRLCPGRILDVPYAELTADPEPTMRNVAAFCGLEYRATMSDPRSSKRAVATASAVQVREGIIERKVPKWVPYAAMLAPMGRALAG